MHCCSSARSEGAAKNYGAEHSADATSGAMRDAYKWSEYPTRFLEGIIVR